MAEILANGRGGFTVTVAHRIVANFLMSPKSGACTYKIVYGAPPPAPGATYQVISGQLLRDMPDGTQQTAAVVLQACGGWVVIPDGTFTGRRVRYQVMDLGATFKLTLTVTSLDGSGLGEVWHQDCAIAAAPADQTDYDVTTASAAVACTSVDITP